MKKKLNAAIIMIVGRPSLFRKTIKLFYKNWNNKYNYPIYVHTFGEIFNNADKLYFKNKYKNIYFETLYPRIPSHIKKKELFYYRFYNNFAYQSFNPKRLGYLHMLHFASNITAFGKTGSLSIRLKNYDYILRIDDDSWFRKKINFNFFNKLKKYPMGTARLTITKNSKIHLTRERLFWFLKKFIKDNKIKVINKKLRLILDSGDEKNLFNLQYSMGNFDFYNMRYFKTKRFSKFIKAVNSFGGIYKYRWADYDLINLYLYIYFDDPILNLKLSENTYSSAHPETKKVYFQKNRLLKSFTLPRVINEINFYVVKRIMRFLYIINVLKK
jgi:hypothetical protein